MGVKLFKYDEQQEQSYPVIGNISAGFPSPADDFLGGKLDLNKYVIRNPPSTFFGIVDGLSMVDASFDEGDLIVIDKSLPALDGKIAVCFLDGEFTVKRIKLEKECCYLMPENKDFEPIKVDKDNDFLIWGIVTTVIKKVY